MIYLDKAIAGINEAVAKLFPEVKAYGLCKHVRRNAELQVFNLQEQYPITVDDRQQMQVYHRICGNILFLNPRPHGRRTLYTTAVDIHLVVYTKERNSFTKLLGVLQSFPSLSMQNADMDDIAVWRREFGDTALDRIDFEHYLYSITYRLEFSPDYCEELETLLNAN